MATLLEKKELQIKLEIKNAQNKLSEIMGAINNERLQQEKAERDTQETKVYLEKVSKEIIAIDKQKEENKNDFQNKKQGYVEILNGITTDITTLKSEIVNLKTQKKIETESLDVHKTSIRKQISALRKEYDLEVVEYVNEITKLKAEKVTLKEDRTVLIDETSENKNLFNESKARLDNINLSVLEAGKVLKNTEKEIESKNSALFAIVSALIENNTEQTSLLKKIKEAKQEITELNTNKDTLQEEVALLYKEKSDFIKGKLALQQDKEVLAQREEFIKEKYQAAGINYS